jgi:hypothetical protein
LDPAVHFGRTYEDWSEVPNGDIVHVHGKGFFFRLGDSDEDVYYTAQVNGPTKGWMWYGKIPRGTFSEVNRISYAGT